jgi:transcriptional regulator with XRE-family HTH domain
VANERLRDAMLTKGVTPEGLAERLNVDPKTVERWITKSRTPYPKYRHQIAALLRESESYLWPDAIDDAKASQISESEIVKVYPHRSSVPADLWDHLLSQATAHVDILVYVGMFMTEKPGLISILQTKGKEGANIRLLFGEPTSAAVMQRSRDEGIGERAIPAKIENALAYFQALNGFDGVEIRQHDTVLYNSIYRFDDQMIINPHVYAKTAPHAPALHLRRLSGGDLFSTYAESFDAVWKNARAVQFPNA